MLFTKDKSVFPKYYSGFGINFFLLKNNKHLVFSDKKVNLE